jgi:hypothetical protein
MLRRDDKMLISMSECNLFAKESTAKVHHDFAQQK